MQKVGLKNLVVFFGFHLGWAITKCKLQNIVFKCYIFQGVFGGICW